MHARMACGALLGMGLGWVCGCESMQAMNQPGRDSTGSSGMSLLAPADVRDAPSILPQTHMAAGRLHESQGRLARAAEQYRQAVALDARNLEAYNRLGVVLDRLGRFKEADEAFQQAIRLAPDQAHLRNNLGFSYMMQSRWQDAERELKAAIDMQPHFARARVNLGMVLAQQDRFDEARVQFEEALPLEDAWYNMGLMYQSRERVVEAARSFQIALETNPRLVAAQKRLDMLPPDIVSIAEAFTFERVSPAPRVTDSPASQQEDLPVTQPARVEEVGLTAEVDPDRRLVESQTGTPDRQVQTLTADESEAADADAEYVLEAVEVETLDVLNFDDLLWPDPFTSPLVPFGHERRLGPVRDDPPAGDAATQDRPARLDPRQRLIFLWQTMAMPLQRLFGPPPGETYGSASMGSPLLMTAEEPEATEPYWRPPASAPAP
jgi:Flp pilus assembly protein TadD